MGGFGGVGSPDVRGKGSLVEGKARDPGTGEAGSNPFSHQCFMGLFLWLGLFLPGRTRSGLPNQERRGKQSILPSLAQECSPAIPPTTAECSQFLHVLELDAELCMCVW